MKHLRPLEQHGSPLVASEDSQRQAAATQQGEVAFWAQLVAITGDAQHLPRLGIQRDHRSEQITAERQARFIGDLRAERS